MASHHQKHYCELDNNFCKTDISECGHDKHIGSVVAKCFSCQFHFEKNYSDIHYYGCKIFTVEFELIDTYFVNAETHAARVISNKGPPLTGFIC